MSKFLVITLLAVSLSCFAEDAAPVVPPPAPVPAVTAPAAVEEAPKGSDVATPAPAPKQAEEAAAAPAPAAEEKSVASPSAGEGDSFFSSILSMPLSGWSTVLAFVFACLSVVFKLQHITASSVAEAVITEADSVLSSDQKQKLKGKFSTIMWALGFVDKILEKYKLLNASGSGSPAKDQGTGSEGPSAPKA